MAVYRKLPGHKIGHHDSFQFSQDKDGEFIVWWHHADRPLPSTEAFRKGSTCSTDLKGHTAYIYEPGEARKSLTVEEFKEKFLDEDFKSNVLVINPSIVCTGCGRHIWYQYGQVSNYGRYNAHHKHDREHNLKLERMQ